MDVNMFPDLPSKRQRIRENHDQETGSLFDTPAPAVHSETSKEAAQQVSVKAGRFECNPRQLKLDILPFLKFDMADTLVILERAEYIQRYHSEGKWYGVVPTFEDHQRITGKEATDLVFQTTQLGKQQRSNRGTPGINLLPGKGRGKEDCCWLRN